MDIIKKKFVNNFIFYLILILLILLIIKINKKKIDTDRPYIIKEKVFKGFNMASKLGWKTANIKLNKKYECGMYSVETNYGDGILVMYNHNKISLAECHILNFNKNIYNKYLYIYSMEKINFNYGVVGIFNNFCKYQETN